MHRSRLLVPTIAVFLVVVLARFIGAALVPIVLDEAYYLEWSKALDWGYYDHPPFVAWIGVTSWMAPSSALAGRVGTMIAAALAFPFTLGLFRRAGITDRNAYIAALLLMNFNFCALMFGVLTTPDAVFVTAWCAALHEAAAAVGGDRRRWITAGLATGIGLLSKYIMVLIGPVFLWSLLRSDLRALRTAWPYAGALIALVVFSPHLAWNARNEWVPIRMQLGHGFQGTHDPGFTRPTDLPLPEPADPAGPETRLGGYFGDETVKVDEPGGSVLPLLRRTSEYIGSLLIVWGAFLAPILHRFILRLRGRVPPEPALRASVLPLLRAATWVPVLFFGFASLFDSVETNWPAVYTVGGAVLLAGFGASRLREMLIFAGINLGIFLVLVLYTHNPRGIVVERLLDETHGWREMAAHVAEHLDGPIFTGREQVASMIRFYQPELTVGQWPGVTQPSEYVRRPEWNLHTVASLREAGFFWLVLKHPRPPRLPGFEPVEMKEVRDCAHQGIVVTEWSETQPFVPPCPDDTVHTWYIVQYVSKP